MASAIFEWNPEPTAISYKYELKDMYSGLLVDSGTTTATSVNFTNLIEGTKYQFTVLTICNNSPEITSQPVFIIEICPITDSDKSKSVLMNAWTISEISSVIRLLDTNGNDVIINQINQSNGTSFGFYWRQTNYYINTLTWSMLNDNNLFTRVDPYFSDPTKSALFVQVKVNNIVRGNLRFEGFGPNDILSMDFTTIGVNLYEVIASNLPFSLDFIWVENGYRSQPVSDEIFNQFGIAYPNN